MESQMHRSHYDDPLHATGTIEEEHGGETKSALKKVKEKVDKLKDTIKHGHGKHDYKDEAHTLNDSPVVRSGLVQPTVMGTPVLVEDLYATHSDIVDPPVRSFAQWEEEEKHGDPPPLSTGSYGTHPEDLSQFGHHPYSQHQSRDNIGKSTGVNKDPKPITVSPADRYNTRMVDRPNRPIAPMEEETKHDDTTHMASGIYGSHPTDASQVGRNVYEQDVNKERPISGIGRSTGMEEDPYAPNKAAVPPANYQTKVTDPTSAGGKEVGITGVLRSFDKMGIYDHEPHTKTTKSDQEEPKQGFTGSHDQFKPEPVESPPLDTIAADPSNKNSSYSQKIKSATSAVTDKAAAVKDSIVSKLSSNKTDTSNESHVPSTKTYSATDYAHVVADTLSGTLGPVYEKVAGAGGSVMSKMQGSGHDENVKSPVTTRVPENKGVTVKEYLVNTFKPGDDDKVLSETITNVFHRGKGNVPVQETTTTYVIREEEEGERRLQEN